MARSFKKNIFGEKSRGAALLISLLLVGVLVSITLVLSAIFIPKIRSLAEIKRSNPALYAAESALEWCLYIRFKTPPAPTPSPPVMSNGATYTNGATGNPFDPTECKNDTIKAIGTFLGISRALEVAIGGATPSPSPSPSLSPSPNPSIIVNGDFESGTSPWNFYTNGAGTFTTAVGYNGTQSAKINITSPGSNVQLYQFNITVEPLTQYRLTFAARSNTGHDVNIYLIKHVSPYTNYGLNYNANLTSTWQTFSTEFTSTNTTTVTDARLQFWLAPYDASGDEYWFDDISIVKIE